MTTPTPAADAAVDELRRRARRRLVGAVVLALAAAVVVPMLLENEPRPLGEDVSVRIPPVDQDRFVNRLNAPGATSPKPETKAPEPKPAEPKAADTKSAEAKAPEAKAPSPAAVAAPEPKPAGEGRNVASGPIEERASAPKRTVAEAEQRVLSPTTKPAPAAEPTKPAAAGDAKRAEAKAGETKVAAADAKPAEGPPKDGAYAVQLAAFVDDKGANALAAKLKKAGFAAYTEPYPTSRGTLWRVRVGPFPTRDAADAARARLKESGQNGIVTAAR